MGVVRCSLESWIFFLSFLPCSIYKKRMIPKTSEYRGQLLLIVYTEGNKVVRVDHLISRLTGWGGR